MFVYVNKEILFSQRSFLMRRFLAWKKVISLTDYGNQLGIERRDVKILNLIFKKM